MISKILYDAAQEIIKRYKIEQLEMLRIDRAKTAITTIPKEEWGVHLEHCCFEHGCKYRDDGCPVELGLAEQRYKCEDCRDDETMSY